MDEAVQNIIGKALKKSVRSRMVVTVNAQFVCNAAQDPHYAGLLSAADLAVADGCSLLFASHLLRRPLPARIPGVDLVVRLCEEAARNDLRVGFVGGREGAAAQAAENLTKRFPGLNIACVECPPLEFEQDLILSDALASRVRAAQPDLIFVGLGSPKQEYWIERHMGSIPGAVMMGVGGSFDMLSGDVPRAPRWMQRAGLEWAFRLLVEPRRLWRRYLLGNMQFVQIVLWQWLTQRKPA